MKTIKKLLALAMTAALAASLGVAASAQQPEDTGDLLEAPMAANVPVGGTVEVQADGRLLVTHPNPEAANSPILLALRETTRVLDVVTLEAVDPATIADGDWIYAWVDPVMALSYPAQAGVQLILVNIPQDIGAPSYHQIVRAEASADGASLTALTDKNQQVTFDADCPLTPYLTRNILTLANLVPGTELLVWGDVETGEGDTRQSIRAESTLIFPYGYTGWLEVTDQAVTISGEAIDLQGALPAIVEADTYHGALVPLRALCEHMGWDVAWDADLRVASVTPPDGEAIHFAIGSAEYYQGGNSAYLTFPPSIQGGRTLLAARDLARLMNLYFAQ